MNHWMLRLTGLFFLLALMLLTANRWLAPELPDSIREELKLELLPPTEAPQPRADALQLLSIQEDDAPRVPAPSAAASPTPAPMTAPSLANTPATGQKRPWVQVGSFSELSNAQNMQGTLRAQGINAQIEWVQAQEKTYHRVIIGPLQEAEAERHLQALQALNIEARVIHR